MTDEFPPIVLKLRDGSEVTVRSIREDDRERLQSTIRSLSDESRYFRFFSALKELPSGLLEQAVHPAAGTELQLLAVVGEGSEETIVGGTRYAATKDAGHCEFAVIVIDKWQGRGLARQLLETLMRTARERGFSHMEGFILASNSAMLGLAKSLGFETLRSQEDPSVCRVLRDLSTVAS